MSDLREPCLKARCYSPIACEGWGYCRERNLPSDEMDANGIRPQRLINERRAVAYSRSSFATCELCGGTGMRIPTEDQCPCGARILYSIEGGEDV